MDEFVCMTLLAEPGESPAAFSTRLTGFWTYFLRNWPSDYEQVYAEATEFDTEAGRVSRAYMINPNVIDRLTSELASQSIDWHPIDRDDRYTRDEASSSDWFQIEH